MKFFSCFRKTKKPPDNSSISKFHINRKEIQQRQRLEEKKEKEKERRYHDFKLKGTGYFSKVYEALDINNNKVAVKKINIEDNPTFYDIAKRECFILKELNSPHIIKMKDVFASKKYIYIIFPLYRIDLFDYIPEVIGKPNKIFKILLGIAKGIQYLHEKCLMHGDIKPENIMLDENDNPINIDLGLCKNYTIIGISHREKLSGTLTYLPPEVINHRTYTEKMDIWAFGVIMYMMMYGKEPFVTNRCLEKEEVFNNIKYLEQYYTTRWELTSEHLYMKIIELNKWTLRKKHYDRASINDIIDVLEIILLDLEKTKSCRSLDKSHKLMISHLKKFGTM